MHGPQNNFSRFFDSGHFPIGTFGSASFLLKGDWWLPLLQLNAGVTRKDAATDSYQKMHPQTISAPDYCGQSQFQMHSCTLSSAIFVCVRVAAQVRPAWMLAPATPQAQRFALHTATVSCWCTGASIFYKRRAARRRKPPPRVTIAQTPEGAYFVVKQSRTPPTGGSLFPYSA